MTWYHKTVICKNVMQRERWEGFPILDGWPGKASREDDIWFKDLNKQRRGPCWHLGNSILGRNSKSAMALQRLRKEDSTAERKWARHRAVKSWGQKGNRLGRWAPELEITDNCHASQSIRYHPGLIQTPRMMSQLEQWDPISFFPQGHSQVLVICIQFTYCLHSMYHLY